ncbi:branched-chain amino acid ABC transporter permease [Gordonia polyisoprenivorans]|nr:branched-chain amino acid ABC transporter permease [Gordonia polyisoprenivorans]
MAAACALGHSAWARLQGTYLALMTLAVGILFPTLIRRFDDLTGGSRGLQGISFRPPEDLEYFSGALGRTIWIFWAVSIALALCRLVVRNIMRSGLGRGIVALRDKEAAGVVMGVNRAFVRTVLFGISAAIAGLAGGFFGVINGIITPDSFTLLLTINLLVGMLIGGSASFWGPIIGGFVVYFVPVCGSVYSKPRSISISSRRSCCRVCASSSTDWKTKLPSSRRTCRPGPPRVGTKASCTTSRVN